METKKAEAVLTMTRDPSCQGGTGQAMHNGCWGRHCTHQSLEICLTTNGLSRSTWR